jgi:uncharacterized protein
VMKRGLLLSLGLGALAGVWAWRRAMLYEGPALGPGPDDRAGTAVVTGGSAGIGMAFAHSLGAQGYNLLLVARRADRLATVAAEVNGRFGVTVETMTADLSDTEDVTRVGGRMAEIRDLSLLVNNAGFGGGGRFADSDLDHQLAMIEVHILATVRLTRAALPIMLARRHGGIINVASLAAFFPVPGGTTYSATKAYLLVFSQALSHEVRGQGVRVQALCPGFTHTEFHDASNYKGDERAMIPDFLWSDADAVVADSLAALRSGEVVCIPGFKNQALSMLARNQLTARFVDLGLDWAERFTGRN